MNGKNQVKTPLKEKSSAAYHALDSITGFSRVFTGHLGPKCLQNVVAFCSTYCLAISAVFFDLPHPYSLPTEKGLRFLLQRLWLNFGLKVSSRVAYHLHIQLSNPTILGRTAWCGAINP